MERALKQRLTGAVILVIVGVVFIPLLLDGAGHNARYSKDVEIPPEPVIQIKSWDELKEIPASSAAQITPAKVEAQPVKPAEKQTMQPSIKAWALQLGSFNQKTNAMVLRDQLRSKGYRAFVDTSKVQGEVHYKVKIGPDLDRHKIEKTAEKLKSNEKIESMVITHP